MAAKTEPYAPSSSPPRPSDAPEQGEEVLHLPGIVEAAEATPEAAREAATAVRRFLSREHILRPHVQYNAVMLVRILADNPGPQFTRYLDVRFVTTTKELLREGRDPGVQQILRETLDAFEAQRADDATLAPLVNMWRGEKAKWAKKAGADVGARVSVRRLGLP